jgi:hypothetical protein
MKLKRISFAFLLLLSLCSASQFTITNGGEDDGVGIKLTGGKGESVTMGIPKK